MKFSAMRGCYSGKLVLGANDFYRRRLLYGDFTKQLKKLHKLKGKNRRN